MALPNLQELMECVTVTTDGATMTIDLIGDIGSAAVQPVLAAYSARARQVRTIEVNLSRVSFMDSNGLNLLIQLRIVTASSNLTLRLHSPTPELLRLLERSALHRVFGIH